MPMVVSHFTLGNYTHEQIARTGDFCVYEQRHRDAPVCRFEVIQVQTLPARQTPSGQVLEAGAYYPRASQWGRAGWTYHHVSAAMSHFSALVEGVSFTYTRPRP